MINTSNARLQHFVPTIPLRTQLPMNSLACTQALATLRASFMFELSTQEKKMYKIDYKKRLDLVLHEFT